MSFSLDDSTLNLSRNSFSLFNEFPLIEIPRTSRPSPRKLSSRLRRASTPNLQIWPKNVEQPPSQALLSPESCLLCPSEKRGSMSTVKSVTLSVHEPQTESTEPSEPATIRSILPGEDTVIELEMEQGRGLGIGFIGGAETALVSQCVAF